jgi:hypothetical protein
MTPTSSGLAIDLEPATFAAVVDRDIREPAVAEGLGGGEDCHYCNYGS